MNIILKDVEVHLKTSYSYILILSDSDQGIKALETFYCLSVIIFLSIIISIILRIYRIKKYKEDNFEKKFKINKLI